MIRTAPGRCAHTRVRFGHGDDGAPLLRFERRLAQPVERVWEALTDEDQLAVWYPTRVRIDAVAGGEITFAFPGGEPFAGEVLDAQPPHLLVFTTRDDVLCWQLIPEDGGTRLILANAVASASHTPYTAAGFHISLDQLATMLHDGAEQVSRIEMPPPDDLVARYARALNDAGQ
jgi:uncharacterized protein YndB with AHSA1/START domain